MHSLMRYWSGLYDGLSQEQLKEGADALLKCAKKVLASQMARQVNRLLHPEGASQDSDEDRT